METDLTVTAIRTVFEGSLKEGFIPRKSIGRHSDGFVCYTGGEAEYTFDGYSFRADAGGFFYLAKDSVYTIRIRQNVRFFCVDFDFCPAEVPRQSAFFKKVPPQVKSDFEKLYHIWNGAAPSRNANAFGALYHLYAEAVRSGSGEYAKKSVLFARAVSYILDRYTDPAFSAGEIAAHLGVSQVHLRRVFQQNAHTCPVKYVNYLRIEKAKNMLRSSNLTVSEIASSVGIADPFYFSRLFKKESGFAPAAYRKQ